MIYNQGKFHYGAFFFFLTNKEVGGIYMNHFELFKLKSAGLTNLNILNILDYQETQDRKLSLRDMAVVSKSKNAVLFMEKYKNLDVKQLKEQFKRFPTLSIFDKEYPIELKHTYNPLFSYFIKEILIY